MNQRKPKFAFEHDQNDYNHKMYYNETSNNNLMITKPNKRMQEMVEVKKVKSKPTTIILYTLPVLLTIASTFVLMAYWMFDCYHIYITSQSESESKLVQAHATWNEFSCDVLYDKLEDNLPNFSEEQIETLKIKYGKQVITSPESKQKCDNAKILLDEGYNYIFWKTFIFSMFYGPCTKLLSLLQTPLTYFFSSVGTIASVVTFLSFCSNYFPLTNLFLLNQFNRNRDLNV